MLFHVFEKSKRIKDKVPKKTDLLSLILVFQSFKETLAVTSQSFTFVIVCIENG